MRNKTEGYTVCGGENNKRVFNFVYKTTPQGTFSVTT